jgi:hypothetical protein
MVDRSLVEFVREALAKGASRADIERALAASGWPADQARSALAAYSDAAFVIPVPLPRPYVSAREAFLYLLLFILLGVVACHLGGLLFVLVDMFLPPDVVLPYMRSAAGNGVRWTVSALVVALPLFLLLSWRLAGARRRNPAMQGSRIRKWLTYLTLVVTASTIVGDLIALVYNFLAGELTLRFLLKAVVIAAIAGVIFFYYVRDAERDEDRPPAPHLDRAFGGGVAAVALAASIAGVAMIESPATLRARERDNERITAITGIASSIDCYVTYESALPESLDAMRAALAARAGATPLICSWDEARFDPATDAPYEYRPLEDLSFELCATFDLASSEAEGPDTRNYSYGRPGGSRGFNAVHGRGRHCFTLEAETLATDDAIVVR